MDLLKVTIGILFNYTDRPGWMKSRVSADQKQQSRKGLYYPQITQITQIIRARAWF